MSHQPPPVSRLRSRVGNYSIVEEDQQPDSARRFVVLNPYAQEIDRFENLEEAEIFARMTDL